MVEKIFLTRHVELPTGKRELTGFHVLKEGDLFLVGRDKGANAVVEEVEFSRFHSVAKVLRDENGELALFFFDLNPKNKLTFIKSEKLTGPSETPRLVDALTSSEEYKIMGNKLVESLKEKPNASKVRELLEKIPNDVFLKKAKRLYSKNSFHYLFERRFLKSEENDEYIVCRTIHSFELAKPSLFGRFAFFFKKIFRRD